MIAIIVGSFLLCMAFGLIIYGCVTIATAVHPCPGYMQVFFGLLCGFAGIYMIPANLLYF